MQIGYKLSSLAQSYVAAKSTMIRDPARTCSGADLSRLLRACGLPATDEVLDFEANLGGWCSTNPCAQTGYGVYLSLEAGDDCGPIATEFRANAWVFEGRRDEWNSDGETSPLWGTGYPRAYFQDRALVPAGMSGLDEFFFLGGGGEVYNWVSPADQLILEAGSGRTLLEVRGLTLHKGQGWFDVHICADVSAQLAHTLSVPRFEPACDHLFQWWASDAAQIRLVPDHAPCITGTHLACRSEADLERALRSISGVFGDGRIRLWKNANIIYDESGIESLLRAGFDCEIVTGTGSGHGGNEYDASVCDTKNST